MGFGGLIPADKLAATYDPNTSKLFLSAEGTVPAGTHGIRFERLPWIGGLKFSLDGWTEALAGSQHYEWEQAFDIQSLSSVDPSNTVIVLTANHPHKGVFVPINWLGLKEQPPKDDEKNGPAPSEPQWLSAPGVQLNELFRFPFIIKQAATVPKGGSVQIKFDPTYLTLTGSGIEDADINWNFNSLQTGYTQIFVTVYGGIANFVLPKVYNVRIFVLDTAAPSSGAPQAQLAIRRKAADKDNKTANEEILSFLGRVNIAVRLVRDKFPDAQLYAVEANPIRPESVTNPFELVLLKVIFSVRKNNKQGTATISSIGWSDFGPVHYVPHPTLGDVVITWPPPEKEELLDLTKADEILRKAGYDQAYTGVSLSQPLYPGVKEPYYSFELEDYGTILVGARDGKIVPPGGDDGDEAD